MAVQIMTVSCTAGQRLRKDTDTTPPHLTKVAQQLDQRARQIARLDVVLRDGERGHALERGVESATRRHCQKALQ